MTAKWRNHAGFLRPGHSERISIQTLLGDFLVDRHSPHLLGSTTSRFDQARIAEGWGEAPPLDKVIRSDAELEQLLSQPQLFRQAICILEPADHVGHNHCGEAVRASLNVACLAQMIADCDSILLPLWESGQLNPQLLDLLFANCLAIVMEGGHPSVKQASSFDASRCSHQELLELTESLLLNRSEGGAPALFICLGHQLVAQAHIRLIQKATRAILEQAGEILAEAPHQRAALESCCHRIIHTGQELEVVKKGEVIAKGWDHPCFAVGLNEVPEAGHCEIVHYRATAQHPSPLLPELLLTHEVTSDSHDGIVEQAITHEKDLNIVMFHSDEVNEEAILFANWAYHRLHQALLPARKRIAVSPLNWTLRLPESVEILCSTLVQGKVCTEVGATCISYKNYETHRMRRSFSCQFHPELLDDLREFRHSGLPDYSELKHDDGVRLLMRILYQSILE